MRRALLPALGLLILPLVAHAGPKATKRPSTARPSSTPVRPSAKPASTKPAAKAKASPKAVVIPQAKLRKRAVAPAVDKAASAELAALLRAYVEGGSNRDLLTRRCQESKGGRRAGDTTLTGAPS